MYISVHKRADKAGSARGGVVLVVDSDDVADGNAGGDPELDATSVS